jgi:hypothetical protein
MRERLYHASLSSFSRPTVPTKTKKIEDLLVEIESLLVKQFLAL